MSTSLGASLPVLVKVVVEDGSPEVVTVIFVVVFEPSSLGERELVVDVVRSAEAGGGWRTRVDFVAAA